MALSMSLKHRPLLREFLAEFLGTFILMVFGVGSVAQAVLSENSVGSHMSIHWSWGFGVALGVSASMGVSGGHINPAVTVAMAALDRLPWRKVPFYMLGQYLGSFFASIIVYLIYIDALQHYDGGNRQVTGDNATAGIWSTYPQPYVSTWNGFGDQVFGTAILLIGVMALTDSRHAGPASSALTPFCIGGVVVVIGMTFGLNCGYAINPARDLAPRIFTAMAGWGEGPFSFRDYNWFWVPIIGPHVGGILGAFVYQFLVGFHWSDDDADDAEATLQATNENLEAVNSLAKPEAAKPSETERKGSRISNAGNTTAENCPQGEINHAIEMSPTETVTADPKEGSTQIL